MPAEVRSLAGNAENAVQRVAAKVTLSRSEARLQQAADRAAQVAQQQKSAELGLQALARSESLRGGDDWNAARARAETWRQRVKTKAEAPTPQALTFREAFREASGPGVSVVRSGVEARRKVQESKEQVTQQTTESEQAKTELLDFEVQHKDAITAEENRLIQQRVGEKSGALEADDFTKIADEARANVATALKLEEMQREQVVLEIEKTPLVSEMLNEEIGHAQARERRPLTSEEVRQMREKVVNQLADKAMEDIRSGDDSERINEQQLVNRSEFSDHFLKILKETHGVDVTNATAEQLTDARTKALKETKVIVDAEETARKQKIEDETNDLRGKPEWQSAYARLVATEITNGRIPTSQRREELMAQADRTVRVEQADQVVNTSRDTYTQKLRARTDIDSKVRITELTLRAKQAADAVVGAKNPRDRRILEQASTNAALELRDELNSVNAQAEQARTQAINNPDDKALQQKAAELDARATQVSTLARSLESKSTDIVSSALEKEKGNQQKAQEELIEAKHDVTRAEFRRNVLRDSNTELHNVQTTADAIPISTQAEINTALAIEDPSQRRRAITELKAKAEKNKTNVAASSTLALLYGLSMFMEAASRGSD